jgi:pimeloyl-ACP methyl ester carboxylesterase
MMKTLLHLPAFRPRIYHAVAIAVETMVVAGLVAWLVARAQPFEAIAVASLPVTLRALYAATLSIAARCLFPAPEATRLFGAAWLRLMAGGTIAIFRNQLGMAFPPRLPRLPRAGAKHVVTVAMVHGYGCNTGSFGRLPERLAGRGLDCVAIDLADSIGDLEAAADEVLAWLHELRRSAPDRPIILTGVSMGGLVARLALARPGAPGIDHLVTISSPHHGTWTARFAFGAAARQMRLGSELIQRLAESPVPCPATAIWTADDAIILPADSGRLPGARTIALKGYTHLSVVGAPEVEAAIARAAARLQAATRARRRLLRNPRPAKPTSIIAQVAGSGTAAETLTLSRMPSTLIVAASTLNLTTLVVSVATKLNVLLAKVVFRLLSALRNSEPAR